MPREQRRLGWARGGTYCLGGCGADCLRTKFLNDRTSSTIRFRIPLVDSSCSNPKSNGYHSALRLRPSARLCSHAKVCQAFYTQVLAEERRTTSQEGCSAGSYHTDRLYHQPLPQPSLSSPINPGQSPRPPALSPRDLQSRSQRKSRRRRTMGASMPPHIRSAWPDQTSTTFATDPTPSGSL